MLHDRTLALDGHATAGVWLRTPRFDLGFQLAALAGILPAVVIYAVASPARANSVLPLAALIAVPFLHVFGSFFFAFSGERNASASPPRLLAWLWAGWIAVSLALQGVAPRGLATFALIYGGWHIFRQNFGFVRELARRAGNHGDATLRRLDHAACAAPAVFLWLLIADRGPWTFMGADVYHVAVPAWLLAAAALAVPATVALRELHLSGRNRGGRAGLLLLAGNAAALVGPALVLRDLTLIYTLSASYHGIQYLAWLGEKERERRPDDEPARALAPLLSAIILSMLAWAAALVLLFWLLPAGRGDRPLLVAWYAIVPFHYFVDGRIWRRRRATARA
jgi:hypothetical protein